MFDFSPVESQFYEMKLLKDYSSTYLRRIIFIKEQIETLQTELEAFGGETGNDAVEEPVRRDRRWGFQAQKGNETSPLPEKNSERTGKRACK
jgi:hypothetical protein